jgi:hypothetical protein
VVAKLRLHQQWLEDAGMGERTILAGAIVDLERLAKGPASG